MEPREAALLSSILHLPAGITITSVHPSVTELVVRVACHAPSMPCPECHQLSARIHGSYQRTVADLPCTGRNVLLLLTVRKFVCTNTADHTIYTLVPSSNRGHYTLDDPEHGRDIESGDSLAILLADQWIEGDIEHKANVYAIEHGPRLVTSGHYFNARGGLCFGMKVRLG